MPTINSRMLEQLTCLQTLGYEMNSFFMNTPKLYYLWTWNVLIIRISQNGVHGPLILGGCESPVGAQCPRRYTCTKGHTGPADKELGRREGISWFEMCPRCQGNRPDNASAQLLIDQSVLLFRTGMSSPAGNGNETLLADEGLNGSKRHWASQDGPLLPR